VVQSTIAGEERFDVELNNGQWHMKSAFISDMDLRPRSAADVCEMVHGWHSSHSQCVKIFNWANLDHGIRWDGLWPEINKHGIFTGNVYDGTNATYHSHVIVNTPCGECAKLFA
jgi:hypothetical protein